MTFAHSESPLEIVPAPSSRPGARAFGRPLALLRPLLPGGVEHRLLELLLAGEVDFVEVPAVVAKQSNTIFWNIFAHCIGRLSHF